MPPLFPHPALRPGTTPHGVKVQASGDGGKGDRPVGQARRPAERRHKQAATTGRGTGQSVGRNAPRGEGSNRRRRQRQGRGRGAGGRPGPAPHGAGVQAGGEGGEGDRPAGRSGAAPRGAKVQTGDEGGSGRAPRHRPGACSRRGGGAPAARAGRPHPPGGLIPICRVRGRGRAGAGAPCAPPRQARLHLPASSKPPGPHRPLTDYPEWPRQSLTGDESDILPPRCPSLGSGPGFPVFWAARTPAHRPDQGDSGLTGADPGRDARPGITGLLSRCAGHPTPPSPCVFTHVRKGAAVSGATRTRRPRCLPHPCRPPRPAAPDRPAGPPPRPRRPPEPPPREAPRPGEAFAPSPPLPSPPV